MLTIDWIERIAFNEWFLNSCCIISLVSIDLLILKNYYSRAKKFVVFCSVVLHYKIQRTYHHDCITKAGTVNFQ